MHHARTIRAYSEAPDVVIILFDEITGLRNEEDGKATCEKEKASKYASTQATQYSLHLSAKIVTHP